MVSCSVFLGGTAFDAGELIVVTGTKGGMVAGAWLLPLLMVVLMTATMDMKIKNINEWNSNMICLLCAFVLTSINPIQFNSLCLALKIHTPVIFFVLFEQTGDNYIN